MGVFSVHTRPGGVGSGATGLAATNELVNRTRLRYSRGISRIGLLEMDIVSLQGATAPAAGDYIEVQYTGGQPPWSGTIREVRQSRDDNDLYHVTAFDPLGEIDRRNTAMRRSYASTTERAILIQILTDLGITTTSHPIRYQAASILDGAGGNAVDAYRNEYDDGLQAILQLAVTYGREVAWTRDSNGAGGHVWTLQYQNRFPDATRTGTPQATLQAGIDLDHLFDITDNYEQATGITVLGQGDGTSVPSATSGSAGGANSTFVVPAKSVTSSSVASSLATTLRDTFGSNRRVLVAPTGFAEPLTDGGIDLGYMVTLRDEAASGLGNHRIMHVEVDEDYTDDWFSRITLIGGTIPALPSVSSPAGVRPPGITDLTAQILQHEVHTQQSDLTRLDSVAVHPTMPQGTSGSAIPDGSATTVTLDFTARTFDPTVDEGLMLHVQAGFTDTAGTLDLIVRVPAGSANILYRKRLSTPGTELINDPIFFPAKVLRDFVGSSVVSDADAVLTNRSVTMRDTRVQLSGWVLPKHRHNDP